MYLGSNKMLPVVSVPRERLGNAVTGGKPSDAVIAARSGIGSICLPGGRIMLQLGRQALDRMQEVERNKSSRRKKEAAAVVGVGNSLL